MSCHVFATLEEAHGALWVIEEETVTQFVIHKIDKGFGANVTSVTGIIFTESLRIQARGNIL